METKTKKKQETPKKKRGAPNKKQEADANDKDQPPKKKKEIKDKKAEINNQIIKHQKVFNKGKVFAIRKLVQKINRPDKNVKENQEGKKERLEGALNAIKHVSERRLAASALLQHRSKKNILSDVEATPDQLAIGYFANIEVVKKTLETIYIALNLDAATFWRRQVKKLFKKKDPDAKTKTTKKVKGAKKEDEDDDEESANEDEESAEQSKKLKKPEKSKKSENSTTTTKVKQSRSSDDASSKPAKITKLEPEDDDDDDDDEEAVSGTAVDDFFITAEGTSYLSNAVVKPVKNDEENDAKIFGAPNQGNKRNKAFNKPNQNDNNRFVENKRPFKRNFGESAVETPAPVKPIDPNLHPSWLAKQKQKPIITGFQGTKITFD